MGRDYVGGWHTVNKKADKKKKRVESDDDEYDQDGMFQPYLSASADPAFAYSGGALMGMGTSAAAGQRKAQTAVSRSAASGPAATEGPSSAEGLLRQEAKQAKREAQREAAAESRRRQAQKAAQKSAEAATAKRRAAQERARDQADESKWPSVAEALAECSDAFMDYFDTAMDEDEILSAGGIGALLAYAPGIFERFLPRTTVSADVAASRALLMEEVQEQAADGAEAALDARDYYQSMLRKFPEVVAANKHPQTILDALTALVAAAYGVKGVKDAIGAKESGRGATLAIELTFSELWAPALSHIAEVAATFLDKQGAANGPTARQNLLRIVAATVAGALASEDKEAAQVALARAAAQLLACGALQAVFDPATVGKNALLEGSIDILGGEVLGALADAVRFVALKQLQGRAYAQLASKDTAAQAAFVVAQVEEADVHGPWAVLALELLARPSTATAKALVEPALARVEAVLAAAAEFSPTGSTCVILLSTALAVHTTHAAGAWRAVASKYPAASQLLHSIATSNKLCELPAALTTIVAAAAQANKTQHRAKIVGGAKVQVQSAPSVKVGGTSDKKKGTAAAQKKASPQASDAAATSTGGIGSLLLKVGAIVALVGGVFAFKIINEAQK